MDSRILCSGQICHYLWDTALTDSLVTTYQEEFNGSLGFDIEYRPNFIKGRPLNKTALVQLASDSRVLLVQVSAMHEFPRTIRNIIEDPNIIKAGVGIRDDARKLLRDFGINAAGCLDLSSLARAVDKQWSNVKGQIGLARLVKAYEGRDLNKDKAVCQSNWELFPLADEQLEYAASDASAGLSLLNKLTAILPDIHPPPDKSLYLT